MAKDMERMATKILARIFIVGLLLVGGLAQGNFSHAQDETECPDGMWLFDHELLVHDAVCIPEKPQRVIALDMVIVELFLATNQTPAAASQLAFDTYSEMHPEFDAVFTEWLENYPDMGFPPNLEVILEAQPDLIISPTGFIGNALGDRFREIAPTVIYEQHPGDWRGRLEFAGAVLGLSETVDELLADYDARVVALQELLGGDAEAIADIEISLVRTFPGQIGLLLVGTTAASVLEDVGLGRPESQQLDAAFVLNENGGRPEILIQAEELGLAEGDVVFAFGDTSELEENVLWQALDAVRDERTFIVGYYWWGEGLLSAHDMLDDLFTYVAEAELTPELANPFEEGVFQIKDE